MGDTVAIWRDGSGWLYQARVTRVTPYFFEGIHNGRIKSSGPNPTRLLKSATVSPSVAPFIQISAFPLIYDDDKATDIDCDSEGETKIGDNDTDSETDDKVSLPANHSSDASGPDQTNSQPVPESQDGRALFDSDNTLSAGDDEQFSIQT